MQASPSRANSIAKMNLQQKEEAIDRQSESTIALRCLWAHLHNYEECHSRRAIASCIQLKTKSTAANSPAELPPQQV
ncbi:hypothetical protein QUB68_01025 [Microcoleus sp. A006_D1]|uniref:hypothetical protein n=1 Tax=Microcoleus sp. A006_D1 TaxID=3055267 RepID=UPI002FD634DD